MLLSDWRVLARRWYVVVVGLMVTAGLAWAATVLVPIQYEVTSNTLMLPPKTTDDRGRPTNPYLGLGGLEGIADVVCRTITDNDAAAAMMDAGLTGEFEMYRDPSAAAPVIYTVVKASTPEQAIATQTYLLERIPAALTSVQRASSVSPASLITSSIITEDLNPVPVRRSQMRALVVALVAGLGLTYFSAGLIDGLVRSRRQRRDLTTQADALAGATLQSVIAPSSPRTPVSPPSGTPVVRYSASDAPKQQATEGEPQQGFVPLTEMFPLPAVSGQQTFATSHAPFPPTSPPRTPDPSLPAGVDSPLSSREASNPPPRPGRSGRPQASDHDGQ